MLTSTLLSVKRCVKNIEFKGTKNACLFWVPFNKEIEVKFYIFPKWFHNTTNMEILN